MEFKEGLFLIAYRAGVAANEGDQCPYTVKPLLRAWKAGSVDAGNGTVLPDGVLVDDDDFVRDRLYSEFSDTEFWAKMFFRNMDKAVRV